MVSMSPMSRYPGQPQAAAVDRHILDVVNGHHLVAPGGVQGDGVDGVDDGVLLHVRVQEGVHEKLKELPQNPDGHGKAESQQGQEKGGELKGQLFIVVEQDDHGEAHRPRPESR